MSKDITKEDVQMGTPAFQWMVREYEQHERPKRWYTVMGLVGALLVLFALWSTNYLFALIVILFAIILYLQQLRAPLEIPFAITDTGVIIGKKWYSYSELKGFWVIYNPPEVKNLYFGLNSFLRHRVQVPLMDYDPVAIRDYLNQFLQEDLEQEEEPFSDRVGRVFRLH